ncbi:hypothetical protein CAPTEDRAFT_197500 [Capitella teleta]|uniref:Uncharacterized protein n=1 Tax=Capitella teleta TaxID=283909 RepID=R7TTR7_CAPTE|nr:hypothetical protein CAPTEDRAFT_197500 [Capitella teleta]|eukprot:ELT94405.1 hypothetical protein CAPTEDRAFT_197500 [Capitella teleta]
MCDMTFALSERMENGNYMKPYVFTRQRSVPLMQRKYPKIRLNALIKEEKSDNSCILPSVYDVQNSDPEKRFLKGGVTGLFNLEILKQLSLVDTDTFGQVVRVLDSLATMRLCGSGFELPDGKKWGELFIWIFYAVFSFKIPVVNLGFSDGSREDVTYTDRIAANNDHPTPRSLGDTVGDTLGDTTGPYFPRNSLIARTKLTGFPHFYWENDEDEKSD